MSTSNQFVVSMKFLGIDAVSPDMKKIADQAKGLKTQMDSIGKGPSGGFKFIEDMNKGFKAATKYLDDMKKKLDEMKSSGFADILAGGAAVAPIVKALHDAGQMQSKDVTIAGATGASAQDIKDIQKAVREASNVTKFSSLEVQDLAVKEATSGLTASQVAQLTPIMAKFAEVQQFGKGSAPEEATTQAISSAHMLGIYDPKQLDSYLDKFNKATFMTPGNTTEFFDTFKYLAPTAKGMGMTNDDILYTAALSNRVGFLGSMGGTESADMILRSIPGIFGGNGTVDKKTGKFKPSKQLGAMMDLGLAKADGSSVFFNNKGQFMGIENFIKQLADHSKGVNPEQLMKDYKNMFGMQGERLAVILGERGGEQLQLIEKQMENMKSITSLQDDYNKSYEGQLAQFHTNLQNLNQDVGSVLLPMATNLIHTMQPYITQAADWIQKHQDEVVRIAEVTAGFGVFLIALGGAKLAIGTLGDFIMPILKLGPNLGTLITDMLLQAKPKIPVGNTLPAQSIQANIVNVYGKSITGGGGAGVPVAGESVAVGGLGAGGAVVAEEATTKSMLSRMVSTGGMVLKGAGSRAAALLPITLALGAWDVMTAPEGHKVETAVKKSGTVIGGWAGAEAGTAMGAAFGSVVPGIGTVIGGALGGIIGGIAGSQLGSSLTEAAMNWIKHKPDLIGDKPQPVPSSNLWAPGELQKYREEQAKKIVDQSQQHNRLLYTDNSHKTFNIQSNDPHAVANEVDSKLNQSNSERLHSIIYNSH